MISYSEENYAQRYYGLRDLLMKDYCKNVRYSERQLEIIRYGIESGVDVSVYANPEIPADIMFQILNKLRCNREFLIEYLGNDNLCYSINVTAKSKTEALQTFAKNTGRVENVVQIHDSE